ncbi:MAG: hypothetical protein AAF358_06950 [Pseudomonadota bacterium]
MNRSVRLGGWSSVSVGVASLAAALELWQKTFGLSCEELRVGHDPELAWLWGIEPEDIVQQALLRTPGLTAGGLHLVEFHEPEPPIRQGAEVFDLCPKNLDIYVDDLPRRMAELQQRGWAFRNDHCSEVEAPDGTVFREVHLPSHDAINVVLLQVLGQSHPFTAHGFAGVGPLITIVGDAAAERRYFEQGFGMQLLTHNLLSGPEVEKMVGLPAGAELDISIWGEAGQHFGQMELIQYRGVEGVDRYPLAKPKSLGVLHVNYRCADLAALAAQLAEAGGPISEHEPVQVLPGSGAALTAHTPAGLRIDIFSQ